ncbi:MAG: hypothetical protein LBR86_01760, partial [Tannerella sp.]|nr:hypothetical protein [Tannerella sp.]
MKKRLYCISKKLVWIIPVTGFCFLNGMDYGPDGTDESGSDNDRTVAAKEILVARWSFDAPNLGR